MKISYRIFLGFALILAVGVYSLISWIIRDVGIQPKKSMEETMVDTAHILASYLERRVEGDRIVIGVLPLFLEQAGKRRFSSRIYELNKESVNLDVYVTDARGVVIFDSDKGRREGEDYSQRSDVFRTLRGRYGARTSRDDPNDPLSSVAYVGAPIRSDGRIIGCLTLVKPWKSINTFIETTRRKIIVVGLAGFIAALLLSFLISRRITRPIERLTAYADAVKEGRRVPAPKLGSSELKILGDSFKKMKASLDGRKYIEEYVQTLTHQLKGPLSAIRGASELLQEDLPDNDRRTFVSNIETESRRIQRIVDRMLELAALEQRQELRNVETIDLGLLVNEITETMAVNLERKRILLTVTGDKNLRLKGERFLIYQAVFNLLQNAVDFTPPGGTIEVEINAYFDRLFLIIRDSGAGIPEYASDKVFDKFYSLQRPDSGKKSSGLGLSLVREVAELHQGSISLKPNTPRGVTAVLKLAREV